MSARSQTSDADCYIKHLARENVMRMGLEGGCDQPRQQIVYPDDSTKIYMPRGTLLFRCNDQSGCCPQKEHSCLPLQEEELRVAFYSIECMGGDSRPTPEYVTLKNHTKCGCRPRPDDSLGYDSPQRLLSGVCGGSRQMKAQPQQYSNYGGGGGSDSSNGGYASYGGYGQQSSGYGSQYAGSQQSSNPMSSSRSTSPCANSMSSGPMVDGQVIRGTIRVMIGPKGFMPNRQQQQPCPYG
ncbi:uncharacterized protein LOC128962348 [Oppia nitens]|uniref:uncharacterized protein LOC128962348 n=1 Tax=Oppia nitens TaxID=1686743 RepID=UPI0023D9A73A|nr:uncharacterized protein LOC128962348 [Oppia nitens]